MKKQLAGIFIFIIFGSILSIRAIFGGSGNNNNLNGNPNINEKAEKSEETEKTKDPNLEQENDKKDNTTITQIIDDIQNNTNKENHTSSTTNNNKYTEINVLMPEYFFNTERQRFADDLLKEQHIFVKFQFTINPNTYKEKILNKKYENIDLLLLPYERSNNQLRNFEFQTKTNIKVAFDPFISEIVNKDRINFLPYSADPMITYSMSGLIEESDFQNIYKSITNRTQPKAKAIPLFFGLTEEDYSNKGLNREYKDIVWKSFMNYFETYNDEESLKLRINSNESRKYNIKDLSFITEITYPQVPYCSDFPSICLQLYNFVGIRFGFLSDGDIVNKYFDSKISNFYNLTKLEMPFYGAFNPIRIRGRGIPKTQTDNNIINSVYLFLGKYMNEHNNYNLRNYTLPTFSDTKQSLDNYELIGKTGKIIDNDSFFIKELQGNKKFWQLIENQISAKDFLK